MILLYGPARTEESMNKLEKALVEENFQVVNVDYPSRDFAIEELAEKVIAPALTQCSSNKKVNFVTHSLGGILV